VQKRDEKDRGRGEEKEERGKFRDPPSRGHSS